MTATSVSQHHQLLMVGDGNAGLSVAAQLLLAGHGLDVAILELPGKHYYQQAWTLVGGGAFDVTDTERPESDYIPKGATWLKDAAATFEPKANTVMTAGGRRLTYDYLVVCPGIPLDWSKIKGLPEALDKNGMCSNYCYELAPTPGSA